MTVNELKKITKCRIFIEWTDSDGRIQRTEFFGSTNKEYRIAELKIVHMDLHGFVLCVELEEEGA